MLRYVDQNKLPVSLMIVCILLNYWYMRKSLSNIMY